MGSGGSRSLLSPENWSKLTRARTLGPASCLFTLEDDFLSPKVYSVVVKLRNTAVISQRDHHGWWKYWECRSISQCKQNKDSIKLMKLGIVRLKNILNSLSHTSLKFSACTACRNKPYRTKPFGCYMIKPHGQLVLVSLTPLNASTPSLSTS